MESESITSLKNRPDLFENTISLIEKSFAYKKNQSFKIDFYPLITKENSHHNFIIEKNGEVMGHVGVKLRFLGNFNFSLKIALIGGVAVSENYRRKGVLTRLLKKIFDIFDDSVGFYILWGDALDIYKKFDFFPAGRIYESKGADNNDYQKRFSQTKFKNINNIEMDQIKRIYNGFFLKKYFSIMRSNNDWEILKKIESCDLYLLKNIRDEIIGYFCQNKGMDLNGIVHEYGFLENIDEEVLNLFKNLKTWSPPHPFKEFTDKIFYLGLFRKGNLNHLNQFLTNKDVLKILKWNEDQANSFINEEIKSIPQDQFFDIIFESFPLSISGLDSI